MAQAEKMAKQRGEAYNDAKGPGRGRDSQINAALRGGIEQMKSHAEVMKKAGAHHDAIAKHRGLQQKHATARAGGNSSAPAGKAAGKRAPRKRVAK